MVVDKFHDSEHSFQIVLHVWNLHIGDGSARRESLELGFQGQLVKGVDVFCYMDMIAVRDIVAVRDALYDAEAFLQALGEFEGGAFQRRAIQRVVDILRSLPFSGVFIQFFHDFQPQGFALRLGQLFAVQAVDAFPEAGVAQRQSGIAAVQVLVDFFAFFQAQKGPVLPEDRRRVRQSSGQTLMTALEGPVAELHALVKDLPEFRHIAAGGESDIHQVYGDHALVKAAVVFGLSVLVHIGSQEASAAHAGVAVALAVFIDFILEHDFFGNVIRHQALGRAFGGQLCEIIIFAVFMNVVFLQHVDELGEGRSNPDALFIFHALIALAQGLFDNQSQILFFLLVLCFVQVHEYGHEGSLSVGSHQSYHLILDHLYAVFHLFPQALFSDG